MEDEKGVSYLETLYWNWEQPLRENGKLGRDGRDEKNVLTKNVYRTFLRVASPFFSSVSFSFFFLFPCTSPTPQYRHLLMIFLGGSILLILISQPTHISQIQATVRHIYPLLSLKTHHSFRELCYEFSSSLPPASPAHPSMRIVSAVFCCWCVALTGTSEPTPQSPFDGVGERIDWNFLLPTHTHSPLLYPNPILPSSSPWQKKPSPV